MVYLEVVSKKYYCFEEHSINGWDTERVIDEWFHQFPIGNFHATRDTHGVGGSTVVVSAKEVSKEDMEEFFKNKATGR